jgi:hypothetical protein
MSHPLLVLPAQSQLEGILPCLALALIAVAPTSAAKVSHGANALTAVPAHRWLDIGKPCASSRTCSTSFFIRLFAASAGQHLPGIGA